MADGYEGLNPGLASALRGLNAVCPHTVNSGRRSTTEQQHLWDEKQAGRIKHAVAKPGTSKHETGDAADIKGDYACFAQHGHEFGVGFPVNGEPWHAELSNGSRSAAGADYGDVDVTPAVTNPAASAIAELMGAIYGEQPTLPTAAGLQIGPDAQPVTTGAQQPAAASSQGGLGDQQIAQAAYAAGFRGNSLVTAVAVALAESGGNPTANASGTEDSRGLWQVNVDPTQEWGRQRAATYGDLYDPSINARAAFDISGGGANWGPWTMYRNGGYQQFLGRAQAAAQGVA